MLSATPASIAGTVINSMTGGPLDSVHVTLLDYFGTSSPYGAMSDAQGHFSIAALPPSDYIIRLERRGFIVVSGQVVISGKAVPRKKDYYGNDGTLELKPGQQLQNVTVKMAPRAILSGRVLDEYGDPVVGLYVEVLMLAPRTLETRRWPPALTNDRGEFRLSVPPGKYYLEAQPQLQFEPSQELHSANTIATKYLRTMYPSATDVSTAILVAARPGSETSGLDIHLAWAPLPDRVLSITGIIRGVPDGAEAIVDAEWTESPSERIDTITPDRAVPSTLKAGEFQIRHLAPGHYRILARCDAGGHKLESAIIELPLTDSNIENLILVLAPGAEVTGRIQWPVPSLPPNKGKRATVTLDTVERQSFSHWQTGEVAPDGTFKISEVFPSRYRVQVQPLLENAYIKTVGMNGRPVEDGILDFTNGADGASLKITVSANGGQVSGRVVDQEGEDSSSIGEVVMFREQEGVVDFDHLYSTERNSDGRYVIHGLPPGRYRLLAIPRGIPTNKARGFEEFIKRNHPSIGTNEFLNQHRRSGEVIDIKEGDNISKILKVTGKDSDDTEE
ncbi:MAG TPA: carboxypeptidase-like regulatory domain-containing protein [Candidatus Saccharimonadales bacterium]|nr:carboxypeptidase-like regulatory domain-containing protein [Candidatus Saccharimonadales bacterium]